MKQILNKVPTMLFALIFTISTFGQYYTVASADGQVHVRVVGTERTIWFGDVPNNGCTIIDKEGNSHQFSEPKAICALKEAAQVGNFSYTVKDFGGSLGLYLEGIAQDTSAADFSTYWVYDLNGNPAQVGVSSQSTQTGDSLYFHFENPATDLNKRAITDGVNYLRSQQQSDGKIAGFNGVSGWAAVAFSSAGITPATITKNGVSVVEYLSSNPPASDAGATEWERSILAISASDANPFEFGGINYVQKLEEFYNNSQIGNVNQLNDDVFGLLSLISAGNGSSEQIKQNVLSFVLSHQQADGGFAWSTAETSDLDTTSATLQALIAAKNTGMAAEQLTEKIAAAKNYLLGAQNSDGGFPYSKGQASNASTTAWALMALHALGENGSKVDLAKSYIRGAQEENGSFKWQSGSAGESFTTSYALTALANKYWPVKIYSQSVPTPSVTPTPGPSVLPSVSPSSMASSSPSVSPSASVVSTVAPSASVRPSSIPAPTVGLNWIQRQEILIQRIEQRRKKIVEKITKRIEHHVDRLSKMLFKHK